MRSLHTIALDSVLFLFWAGSFIKKILLFVCTRIGLLLYWLGKRIGRGPVLAAYKVHLKLQSRFERLGGTIQNPFFYFFNAKIFSHAFLLGIGVVITVTNIHTHETAPDILNPHNILSRVIARDNEGGIEEEEAGFLLPGQSYTTLSGVQQSPGFLEEGEEEDASSLSGQIAVNPGALIKPILPTSEKRVSEPAANRSYTVQDGDTLSGIASRFGLKTTTILWANNLSFTSTLRVGMRLTILPKDGILYRVRSGDTLEQIAHEYQTTVDKIMATNSLSSDRLAIGASLMIPDAVIRPSSAFARAEQSSLLGRLKKLIQPNVRTPKLSRSISGVLSMVWPTTARRITQYFSWRHSGVDIAGPPNNKIFAAANGVVELSGWQRGYGNTVVINHGNGRKTRYAHASKLFVRSGQHVAKGETIAMVGSTGRSTGPHLHFEMLVSGRRVNPLTFVR